jgi:hypothetical protein
VLLRSLNALSEITVVHERAWKQPSYARDNWLINLESPIA